MPEMIPLGWFHTIMGAVAILSGVYALYKFKEITWQTGAGQIYLSATLITAATALAIYQQGSFGPGHVLAVLTLGAIAVGTLASTSGLFGAKSRQVRAISYTATLLFHSIPAVTDGLLRLPVGNPVLDTIESPVLLVCYAVLLVLYILGISAQLRWIGRQQPS